MQKLQLPNYETARDYYISPEGLQKLLSSPRDEKYPHKDLLWTDDFKAELPIRMGRQGTSAIPPSTLIEEFKLVVTKFGDRPALSHKHEGHWVTLH